MQSIYMQRSNPKHILLSSNVLNINDTNAIKMLNNVLSLKGIMSFWPSRYGCMAGKNIEAYFIIMKELENTLIHAIVRPLAIILIL